MSFAQTNRALTVNDSVLSSRDLGRDYCLFTLVRGTFEICNMWQSEFDQESISLANRIRLASCSCQEEKVFSHTEVRILLEPMTRKLDANDGERFRV